MDNIQICLANNMKKYRKQMHFSQEKLAEKAGASTNYIALIENGKYFPSLQMLKQIASALEIDALDLFDKNTLVQTNLENLKNDITKNILAAIELTFEAN